MSTIAAGHGIAAAAASVLFVFAVFGCVVLHELGHALMARRFGIGTRDITLLPIGGLARLHRMPERPIQELAVALAGPAVNVVIAAFLFGVLILGGAAEGIFALSLAGASVLVNLMWANVILVLFNMLPAFPMDGGRVLRALLAMRFSYRRATELAAGLGQILAVCLGVLGMLTPGMAMLVVLAVFVFMAARAELAMVRMGRTGRPTASAPTSPLHGPHYLPAEARIEDAAKIVLFTPQYDFPVVYRDRMVGLLSRSELLRALSAGYGQMQVADMMRRQPEPV